MSRRALVGVVIVGLAAMLITCTRGSVAPPSAMVGHWEGTAEVAVNWCNAKELAVSFTINSNGAVAGKVGDAILKEGHIYPNPGRPPKGFTLQTNYVIEADLEGPLVAAEGITRDTICIPVDVNKDGQLAGAFLTSGTEYGSKDEKVFSAGLKPLTKTPAP
ncbi:MAG TPA: hypothetical protein VI700_03500 [Thermoanaerobaculaceae bacterium]|nr:hypothetical protein [Thermoanaerobaculaceae bacterium]